MTNMGTKALTGSALFSMVFCLLLPAVSAEREWSSLKVTWTNSTAQEGLPLTVEEAVSQNWTKFSECQQRGRPFRGVAYVKDNDFSLVLLFDYQGNLTGLQTGMRMPKGTDVQPFSSDPFVYSSADGRHYLTAYLERPWCVCGPYPRCHRRRDLLFLQQGARPVRSPRVLKNEPRLASTAWTRSACLPHRGTVYWRGADKNATCEGLLPFATFYRHMPGVHRKRRLASFAFVIPSNVTSPHYEVISEEDSSSLAPACLEGQGQLRMVTVELIASQTQDPC